MSKRSFILLAVFFVSSLLFLSGCTPPAAQLGSSANAGAAPPMSNGEFWFSTIWFLLIGLSVYYLMVIRPQVTKDEGQQKFIKELKKNDEVMTSGGLLGKVIAVYEDHIAVELGPNVKVRVRPEHVKTVPAKPVSAEKSKHKEK